MIADKGQPLKAEPAPSCGMYEKHWEEQAQGSVSCDGAAGPASGHCAGHCWMLFAMAL